MEVDLEIQLEAMAQLEVLKRERDAVLEARASHSVSGVQKYRQDHEANKKQLKSDLKKGTAFGKKIKMFTPDGLQQCVKDVEVLNLTNYISEIVAAIIDVNYKITDVPVIVNLCIALHRRYEDFTVPFISGIRECLMHGPDDDTSGKKKRIQLRLFIELFQNGLHNDDEFFAAYLRKILGKSKGCKKTPIDLQGLQVFVKSAGEVLLGYVPSRYQLLARQAGKSIDDVPLKLLCKPECSRDLQCLVDEVYETICVGFQNAHKDFISKKRKNEKDTLINGSISEQRQIELEQAEKLFERLHSTIKVLADASGKEIPNLKIEEEEQDPTRGISLYESGPVGSGGVYGDLESKSFYEDLPDLLSMVPLDSLGLTPEQVLALREKWKAEKECDVTPSHLIAEEIELSLEAEGGLSSDVETEGLSQSQSSCSLEIDCETDKGLDETPGRKLIVLLEERLPEVVTKQKADEFCSSFCYSNSKNARKKLVQHMTKVPRGRVELIANFSRIIASLNKIFGDMGTPLVESLFKDFYGMYKTKSQSHLESKIKNVRYIGELIKFKVAAPIVAFKIFKLLLSEFSGHNIELLAVLMESCGRYLYLVPYTHDKMNDIIETMIRLKKARNLDLNQIATLDSALFTVKPPEAKARKSKVELSVVQKYVHHLIKLKLSRDNVDDIVKSLRRLPWSNADENIEYHVMKASLSIARKKYVHVDILADCLSGLSRFRPNTIIQLVDKVLEDITRGLENPRRRDPQRILSLIRLLGELYNYSILSSQVVFDTLYHIINFGHEVVSDETNQQPIEKYNPKVQTEIDPPGDCFRAQLVCEMLNTCGAFYVRGPTRAKLSQFLLFFQRYLLSKPALPAHVEFDVLDVFDLLEELARTADRKLQPKSTESKWNIVSNRQHRDKSIVEAAVSSVLIFSRYDSYDAVQVVIEQMVTSGQLVTGGATEGDQVDQDDDNGDLEDDEDDERDDDDEREEDGNDNEEDEDDEGEDEQEDDEEDDEEEEDEEGDYIPVQNVEEDEEFDKAFRDMVLESIDTVKTLHKVGDIDRMVIPTVIPKPKNTFAPMLDDDGSDGYEDENDNSERRTVTFKLLSRDVKGRIESRQLLVPEESDMVLKMIKSEESEREERELLKQRALMFNALTEEERFAADEDASVETRQQYLGHSTGKTSKHIKKPQIWGSYDSKRVMSGGGSDSLNLNEFLAVSESGELSGFTRREVSGGEQGRGRGRGFGRGGRGQGRLREFGR